MTAFADGSDVSNRCSLTSARLLCPALDASFESGLEACRPRTVSKTFDRALDLSESPMIEFALLVPQGPGRDFDARLTIHSSQADTFSATAHIIPTLWQVVIFDMHECPFLDDVAQIDISVVNHSSEAWSADSYQVANIKAGKVLDLNFDIHGSAERLTTSGKGSIRQTDGAALFTFTQGDAAEISTAGSRNNIYNPRLNRRNTIAVTLDNQSTADSMQLAVTTECGCYNKTLPITAGRQISLFNMSDIEADTCRIQGLRLTPVGGAGSISIDRISFENERPITALAGKIFSCTASPDEITITGELNRADGVAIEIRHCPHWQSELPFDSLELLASSPAKKNFTISGIPNSRLDGKMSHLSSRMVAALRMADGTTISMGEPFFISNWRDFISNPYSFDTVDRNYPVENFGAKGDGITNDNGAIQGAIDAAATLGGGKVILSGNRTYLATNLELRRGVELVIDSGSTLRQSPIFDHYKAFPPEYGHDNVIPNIPWTHCMYTNRPLILAKDTDHVKITGGGTIRMEDVYSENPLWSHYARVCSDRIHLVPIAICNTKNVEISDIDILRCSNYHTIFYRADSVFVGNVKMYEVACLSGDGLSFGNAVTNVRVGRCVFESNDDGIVLCSSYKDPRGGVWRERVDSIDSSVRHIEVLGSYIDGARGGGGKAIALIPWGSTNPRQDYNEIDNIEVRDCVLRGGHSVGSWPDNPFDGKPFDNAEPDDYAPVKNLRIFNNEYLSAMALNGVVPTTLLTDCGLHGSSTFKNADFTDRTAYWTVDGTHQASAGEIKLDDAIIYQGLHLNPGSYTIAWEGNGKISPYICDINGNSISDKASFEIKTPSTVLLGVKGRGATIKSITLK